MYVHIGSVNLHASSSYDPGSAVTIPPFASTPLRFLFAVHHHVFQCIVCISSSSSCAAHHRSIWAVSLWVFIQASHWWGPSSSDT